MSKQSDWREGPGQGKAARQRPASAEGGIRRRKSTIADSCLICGLLPDLKG